MRATVIPAPESVLLDVVGATEQFPVRRVYCVGRNYADHAIEMGHDPSREAPFFRAAVRILPPKTRCPRSMVMASASTLPVATFRTR